MAELNLQYRSAHGRRVRRLEALWARVRTDGPAAQRIAGRYLAGELTMDQIKCLVAADAVRSSGPPAASTGSGRTSRCTGTSTHRA